MKKTFKITGMTCSSCSAHIEKAVSPINGVNSVVVNLLLNNMTVDFDTEITTESVIIKSVENVGFSAVDLSTNMSEPKISTNFDELKEMKQRLMVSFGFMIPLMYIAMGSMMGLPVPLFLVGMENSLIMAFTQLLLTVPIIYVNRKYYINGFSALIRRTPNMDSLIAVGSSAALVYGIFAIYQMSWGFGHDIPMLVHTYMHDLYFESAAMILALITLGKYMETRSKGKTSEAIAKLIELAPKTALVLTDEGEKIVPVEAVGIGDLLLIKAGASIPVDGVIIEGYSAINQAALTGESIPVEKNVGDNVLSASINGIGVLKIRATKTSGDSTLAQIIKLVEEASASKAPISKLADKVSGVFVPTVMGISLISFLAWYFIMGQTLSFSVSIAIAVLVISCPCALGLATPVAIMIGTGKGAQNGILIKSGEALEIAHSIDTVVLDKTGTITLGKPSVTDIIVADGFTEIEFLRLASSLEQFSEHPLASAVMEKSKELNLTLFSVSDFEVIPGMGVLGNVNNLSIIAGNKRLIEGKASDFKAFEIKGNAFAESGKTPLYFSSGNKMLGILAIADTIKPTSAEAIKGFRDLNIEVIMLTGDNALTAKGVGEQVGVDIVIADVLPQDKEKVIAELQSKGKKVLMVGDGINDAPALARADVAIAIGSGMDIAIESADIVLMKNDLLDAVTAIKLSKAVINNIKQNLFWAFNYNIVGIPLAMGLFYPLFEMKLNPMIAAAAMSFSSLFVVSNALRLRLFVPYQSKEQTIQPVINTTKKMEEKVMTKTIKIEGMMCSHCTGSVSKVLNAMDGVEATVDLEGKKAIVTLTGAITDEMMSGAITEAGYTVISIEG